RTLRTARGIARRHGSSVASGGGFRRRATARHRGIVAAQSRHDRWNRTVGIGRESACRRDWKGGFVLAQSDLPCNHIEKLLSYRERRRVMSRRHLAVAALAALISTSALAQERTLNILSHAVHQRVAHGDGDAALGGDIAGEWAERNNVTLNWITPNVDPIHERLLRELALNETSIDLAFVVNSRFTPLLLDGLEPLGALAGGEPVEDVDGIAEGLLRPVTIDGDLVAIPYRHTTNALIYNAAILAEHGFDGPPGSVG